ncbi:MAG: helix-turn-helix transcriptional regulator [Methylobacterium mesophilicum]|nr:helix-turn-helix transcriptional regulator [Methylobacterium mesophilicum]
MKLGKITKIDKPSFRHLYDDACGTAHALDLVGERWSLLVVRELILGPRRFSDLRAGLPGISANVLTQRLESLELAGILFRRRLPPPAASQVYELTPWGYEAEEPIKVLGRWAARSPNHDPSLPLSSVSLMLSLRTMFSAGRARDFAGTIGLALDGENFRVGVENGTLSGDRSDRAEGDAVLTGTAATLAAAIYGGVPFAALEEGGALRVEGDRALAERFVSLFPLPSKA